MLVDENRDDCALFGIAVDKTGLNIFLHIVTEGEQAIDYLEGRNGYTDRSRHPVPGLVVLDLDIRMAAGLDFLNWRKASPSFSSLPLVIFSDFDYKGTRETGLAMGANAFIAKPFVFDDWEPVVQRIWDLGMQPIEPGIPAFAVGG